MQVSTVTKIGSAFALAAGLSGCGWFDRAAAVATGYSTMCVKETGVKYVQFASGAAPLIDKNGKPVPCDP